MQVQTRNLAARELWMKGSCFFIDPGARRRDKGKGSEYKSITKCRRMPQPRSTKSEFWKMHLGRPQLRPLVKRPLKGGPGLIHGNMASLRSMSPLVYLPAEIGMHWQLPSMRPAR
jgi:hypothetical protein